VFNAAPVSNTAALAELSPLPSSIPSGSAPSPSSSTWAPVQISADQTLLFFASVPALGYAANYFSNQTPYKTNLSCTEQDGGFTLQNAEITASIDATGTLTSFIDRNTGDELLAASANVVRFYQDGGNIYRFGFEIPDAASEQGIWDLSTLAVTWQAPRLIEKGPLRLRVVVQGSMSASGTTIDFSREYRLVAGEPYLQMMTTGTAPSGYTVMLAFPFVTPIASLQHGTTAHWADDAPRAEFVSNSSTSQASASPLTVEATHEYVLPTDASGATIAGMYHASTPGWAIDNTDASTLLACILRNTPATNCNGAYGSDSNAAIAQYALRVPSGLAGPSSAQPLCEALEFIMPPMAYPAAATPTANPPLPASMSIAATDEDSTAIVTSVKAGSVLPGMIVRTYQPTNSTTGLTFTVSVADILAQRFQSNGSLNVVPCTALEVQTSTDSLPATTDTFTVTASRAIGTVALTTGS
jgi:alpha-mannosidase